MRRTADVLATILTGVALVAACGEPAPEPSSAAPEPPAIEHVEPPAEPEPVAPRRTRWERVDDCLAALTRTQSDDGSWGTCGDPGITGFGLLSFFSVGETHNSGMFKDTVKAALGYLTGAQNDEGGFAPGDAALPIESQLPAVLAITEAYGLTGSRLYKDPAQRAFRFLLASQNEDGGWGEGASNTSATVWGVMILKSAQMSEVGEDSAAMARASDWVASVTDLPSGRVEWTREGAVDPGWPLPSLSGDALFAGAIVTRVFAGEDPRANDELRAAASLLLKRGQTWSAESGPDRADDWWFGTIATWQASDEFWVPWCDALWSALDARALPTAASADDQQRTMNDDAIRLLAVHVLTARATQGYRRVFPDSKR